MTIALHIVALVVGLYLWSLTYVMHKSTEGIWTNRIEELRIRLDDRNKTAAERTKALFSIVAERVTRTFNWVFGPTMFSPRFVGVSTSLSLAGAFFLIAVRQVFALLHNFYLIQKFHPPNAALFWASVRPASIVGLTEFAIAGLFFTLALLASKRSRIWSWVSCVPIILMFALFTASMFAGHMAFGSEMYLLPPVLSLLSDILLLVIVRRSLRWLAVRTTFVRIVISVFVQILIVIVVFVIPYMLSHSNHVYPMPTVQTALHPWFMFLKLTAAFNFLTAFAALSFSLSLIFLFLHRLTWPILGRAVYILTRNEVLDKRKTVRWVAAALFIYGAGGISKLAPIVSSAQQFLK